MPEPPRPFPRFLTLFAIAFGVRVLVVVLGVVLARLPPRIQPDDPVPLHLAEAIRSGSARAIEPWYRWDAVWLANVAEHGYAGAADDGGRLGVAFMPVMSAILAASAAVGFNPFWVGIIAANLAAAAGTAVFARVAARLAGDRDTGLRAFVLVLAFPASFFFSAPYNEAFGLLFTALALSAWVDRRAARAGVFAALGSLARMTGIAVGVAALVGWTCDDRTRGGLRRALIVAFGSFAGLALFWGYLGWAVGDPLAGLKSQAAWGRRGLSAWNPLLAVESIYDPGLSHWGEAFVVLSFAVLGVRAWIKRGAFWGVLTLAPVAQMMMSGTFLSGHRLVLAALPAFIELADVLRNRLLWRLTLVGFGVAQFVLLNRYVHWQFAG